MNGKINKYFVVFDVVNHEIFSLMIRMWFFMLQSYSIFEKIVFNKQLSLRKRILH